MGVKFMTAEEAVKVIEDNDTLAVNGFIGTAHPEALSTALEGHFLENESPTNFNFYLCSGTRRWK